MIIKSEQGRRHDRVSNDVEKLERSILDADATGETIMGILKIIRKKFDRG